MRKTRRPCRGVIVRKTRRLCRGVIVRKTRRPRRRSKGAEDVEAVWMEQMRQKTGGQRFDDSRRQAKSE